MSVKSNHESNVFRSEKFYQFRNPFAERYLVSDRSFLDGLEWIRFEDFEEVFYDTEGFELAQKGIFICCVVRETNLGYEKRYLWFGGENYGHAFDIETVLKSIEKDCKFEIEKEHLTLRIPFLVRLMTFDEGVVLECTNFEKVKGEEFYAHFVVPETDGQSIKIVKNVENQFWKGQFDDYVDCKSNDSEKVISKDGKERKYESRGTFWNILKYFMIQEQDSFKKFSSLDVSSTELAKDGMTSNSEMQKLVENWPSFPLEMFYDSEDLDCVTDSEDVLTNKEIDEYTEEMKMWNSWKDLNYRTGKDPLQSCNSTMVDLCHRSGAKDALFVEFDSFIARIISEKSVACSSEEGVPFLQIISRVENFFVKMKHRNILVKFLFFSDFDEIWKPGVKVLRKLVLEHMEKRMMKEGSPRFDLLRFKSPFSEDFAEFMEVDKPYVFAGGHSSPESVSFVADGGWELINAFIVFLFKSDTFHVVSTSSITFNGSTISGSVYDRIDQSKLEEFEEKQVDIKTDVEPEPILRIEKFKQPHIAFIHLVLQMLPKPSYPTFKNILFETTLLQKTVKLEHRCLKNPKTEIPRLPEAEEFLHAFFKKSNEILNAASNHELLASVDVDFVDCNLFHILCMQNKAGRYECLDYESYERLEEYEEVEGEGEESSSSESEKEDWNTNSDSEEEEDWMVEDLEKDQKKKAKVVNKVDDPDDDELYEFEHDIMKEIDPEMEVLCTGSVVFTPEKSEREDGMHWKIQESLNSPNRMKVKRWKQREQRIIHSFKEEIEQSGKSNISFSKGLVESERNKIDSNKKKKTNKKERKKLEEKKRMEERKSVLDEKDALTRIDKLLYKKRQDGNKEYLKVAVEMLVKHGIDLTEELILWFLRDISRLEMRKEKTEEEEEWRIFYDLVMIQLLIDIKERRFASRRNKSKKSESAQKKVMSVADIREEINNLKSEIEKFSATLLQESEFPSPLDHAKNNVMREGRYHELFTPSYQMRMREKHENIEDYNLLCELRDFLSPDFEVYKKSFGFIPDEWQKRFMRYVDDRKRVLVCTPTSSGKTFLSLYLIGKILMDDSEGTVVYVSPINSLVRQMACDIYKYFGDSKPKNKMLYDRTIGILTSGDKMSSIRSRVLVTNAECLHVLMLSTQDSQVGWRKKLKYIIFDEVHTINELEKGDTMEKIILMAQCPYVALSASIGNQHNFFEWFKRIRYDEKKKIEIEHIFNSDRPNDLKYHVFDPKKQESGNMMQVIHPVGLLNDKTNSPETIEHETNVLKRLTPSQSVQFYKAMVETSESLEDLTSTEKLRIQELSPDSYFRILKFALIPRYEGSERTLHSYEMELRKLFVKLVKNESTSTSEPRHRLGFFQDVVLKCRNGLFSNSNETKDLSGDEDRSMNQIGRLFFMMKTRKFLPALVFHFSQAGVQSIAERLHELLEAAEMMRMRAQANEEKEEEEEDIENEKTVLEELFYKYGLSKDEISELGRSDELDVENQGKIEGVIRWIKESERRKKYSSKYHRKDYTKENQGEEEEEEEEEEDMKYLYLRHGIGIHHGSLEETYRAGVERLFRTRRLKVLICTGTLSYGINAPCKTVCLFMDSPWLTPTMFSQTTGRAGRRGHDTLGKIIVFGIPKARLRRLMVHDDDKVVGNTLMSPSYVIRMMVSLASKNCEKNVMRSMKQMMSTPLSCVENLDDLEFVEEQTKTIMYYFRFAIEFFREIGLIDKNGKPMKHALLAAHLFHTEPSNLLFIYLMKNVFKKKEEEDGETKKQRGKIEFDKQIKLLMCHLFTDMSSDDVVGKSGQRLVLEDLDERIMKGIEDYTKTVGKVFRRYLRNIAKKQNSRNEHELPMSRLKFRVKHKLSNNKGLLDRFEKATKSLRLRMDLFNVFDGLGGNSIDRIDEMEIPDILQCLDVFFEHKFFPIPYSMLNGENKVSSICMRYMAGMKEDALVKEFDIKKEIVREKLTVFRRAFMKIENSLSLLRNEEGWKWLKGICKGLGIMKYEFNQLFFGNSRKKWKKKPKKTHDRSWDEIQYGFKIGKKEKWGEKRD